jgi:cytochrome P450
VSRAFTPAQIAKYEPLVRAVVDGLLLELPTSGEFDSVSSFTNRLPIQVIAQVLGLPTERLAWLYEASREIGGILEPLTLFDPDSMSRRFADLDDYFIDLVERRRRDPGNDVISALAADGQGPILADDEIVAMIASLLFAGHETVTGMLGNALIALACFPDQRHALRRDHGLIDNAVEELLRYDTSAQVTGRKATGDLALAGKTIRRGDNIGLMLAAANRDKRRWPDADLLRLDRPDPAPISFGFGTHRCLGAALARMELRLAIPPLLDRLGDYTVDLTRATWRRSFASRGPLSLPLSVGAD